MKFETVALPVWLDAMDIIVLYVVLNLIIYQCTNIISNAVNIHYILLCDIAIRSDFHMGIPSWFSPRFILLLYESFVGINWYDVYKIYYWVCKKRIVALLMHCQLQCLAQSCLRIHIFKPLSIRLFLLGRYYLSMVR